MQLKHLLSEVQVVQILGDSGREVGQISSDSRTVAQDGAFVAVRGATTDGHQFIDTAIEKGAKVLVVEQLPENAGTQGLTWVLVKDSAEALGQMASAFYGHPSRAFQLIGITGTNGKTTTTTLLWQLFTGLGFKCGLIGTVENRVGETITPSTHTTPDSIRLHGLFRQMADAACRYVFMEVSSHAVHQKRIAGATFAGGVFTNLTHDHLDYHGTFAAYRDAKKLFFDHLPAGAFALVNADDKNGMVMLQNTQAQKCTYALKKPADYKTKILENALSGLHLQLNGAQVHARVIGTFNAYNLTAAFAVAHLLGVDEMQALTVLSNLSGAEGRFDHVAHPGKPGCIGIVDYAHTPDALEKVLETIAQLKKKNSRVITLTGAGGDRDKTKRPIMAAISARMSDQLILTSDNPRTEDPAAILRDMEAGLDAEGLRKTLVIQDRAQAIRTAVRLAGPNDVILLAGKGHEKYQDINGVKHPFDDKALLLTAMQEDR